MVLSMAHILLTLTLPPPPPLIYGWMLPTAPRGVPLPPPPFLLCRLTPYHYPQSKPTYTMTMTAGMYTALQWHVVHANGSTAQRSWLVAKRASPNKTLTRLQVAGWVLGCRDTVSNRSDVITLPWREEA